MRKWYMCDDLARRCPIGLVQSSPKLDPIASVEHVRQGNGAVPNEGPMRSLSTIGTSSEDVNYELFAHGRRSPCLEREAELSVPERVSPTNSSWVCALVLRPQCDLCEGLQAFIAGTGY